jgi:hypothetical protein
MILMLVPFYSMGHVLFSKSDFRWNVEELILLFQNNFWAAVTELSWSISYAVAVWLIFAPAGILIIYLISLKIIKRFKIQATS